MSHHDNGAEHVYDLIKDQRTAMLTTVHDEGGTLASRPMACQQVDPDGTLWFLAFSDSEKAEEIRRRPEVNVAFTQEGKWVSLAGRASVTRTPPGPASCGTTSRRRGSSASPRTRGSR